MPVMNTQQQQTMQPNMQQNQQRAVTVTTDPQTRDRTWSGDISYAAPEYNNMQGQMPGMIPNTMPGLMSVQENQPAAMGTLQFNTGLSQSALGNPMSTQEAYQGSLRALLAQNIGHYVVATFLIGTQSPVSWEGFLHSVGNDYLVIFQPDQGRYITGDFYALKFVEFHDTKGVVPPCAGYRRRDGQHIW